MEIFHLEKIPRMFACFDDRKNVNTPNKLKLRMKILIDKYLYLAILFRIPDRNHFSFVRNDENYYLHSASKFLSTCPSENILPFRGNFYNKSLPPIKISDLLVSFILL